MLLLMSVSLEAHRKLLVKPVSLLRPFQRHWAHIPTGSWGMRPDVQSEEGSKQVMTKRGRNRKLFFFCAWSSCFIFVLFCIYCSSHICSSRQNNWCEALAPTVWQMKKEKMSHFIFLQGAMLCLYQCSSIALREKKEQEKVPLGLSLDETIQIWTSLEIWEKHWSQWGYIAFIHLLISSSLPFLLVLSFCACHTLPQPHTAALSTFFSAFSSPADALSQSVVSASSTTQGQILNLFSGSATSPRSKRCSLMRSASPPLAAPCDSVL